MSEESLLLYILKAHSSIIYLFKTVDSNFESVIYNIYLIGNLLMSFRTIPVRLGPHRVWNISQRGHDLSDYFVDRTQILFYRSHFTDVRWIRPDKNNAWAVTKRPVNGQTSLQADTKYWIWWNNVLTIILPPTNNNRKQWFTYIAAFIAVRDWKCERIDVVLEFYVGAWRMAVSLCHFEWV